MKMQMNIGRRGVLRGVMTVLVAPGAGVLRAQAVEPRLEWLTERVALITGAGGNVVVYKGEQGLTVVDSGEAQYATALLKLIDRVAEGAPVKTLFNTHWHADHSGGNEALAARGARIVAHENTKLWLGAEFEVWWRDGELHRPRPREAWPTDTFYGGGELDLYTGGEAGTSGSGITSASTSGHTSASGSTSGSPNASRAPGSRARYAHAFQAHTDGDAWLHFPEENILVLGGLMSDGSYPICDQATGGWIGGLVNANKAILETFAEDTILIPERGPARTMADLRAQLAMLEDVMARMKVMAQDGYSPWDMLEHKVTEGYDATWGDPTAFVLETYQGMAMHTAEMGGFI